MEPEDSGQAHFTRPLLKWYDNVGRQLPWRETKNPYAIWVSEIMLQQTQVATVLPYYPRFLKAFPNIPSLAAAELEAVLMLWQGLGYYARARNLHKAAKKMLAAHQGQIPQDFKALHALPGIGRSSAGAILCIAFGQRHPILDGNVRRVLCRFFAIDADPKDKAVEAKLWAYSEALLPHRRPDLFLQAIMDLGATCCLPKQAQCPQCPLKSHCGAYQEGLQNMLPRKAVRKKSPHFAHFALVLRCKDQVLIRRRPLEGLLAGLWEFPGARVALASERPDVGLACDHFMTKELGLEGTPARPWMKIKHVFTHFKMTLHVYRLVLQDTKVRSSTSKWLPLTALADHPFSAAHLQIVKQLREPQA